MNGCRIAKTEGFAALYVGIGPSLLGMIPSGAVYYWYGFFCRTFQELHVIR